MPVKSIELTLTPEVIDFLEEEAQELNADISVAAEMVPWKGIFSLRRSREAYRDSREKMEEARER